MNRLCRAFAVEGFSLVIGLLSSGGPLITHRFGCFELFSDLFDRVLIEEATAIDLVAVRSSCPAIIEPPRGPRIGAPGAPVPSDSCSAHRHRQAPHRDR
jgi:hypothetical protein